MIRSQAPDAVALAEALERANVDALAAELGFEAVFGEAANGFHVAWLSRLPVRRSANHRSPLLAKTLLEIEVEVDGEPVHLFATHLASRHDAPLTPAAELRAIVDTLAAVERPHALLGDFNALAADDELGTPPPGEEPRGEAVPGTPREALKPLLERGYVDCYRRVHPGERGHTYPADAPWMRLDYVFASSQLAPRLVACDVPTADPAPRASDHLPVVAEFA